MDDVIRLVSETISQDDYGAEHSALSYREVLCKVASVSRAEFFDAGRSGLKPEYRFTVADVDYHGETIVEYRGQTYAVYRTYKANGTTAAGGSTRSSQELGLDYVELYVQRKGGTNGKEDSD